MSMQFIAHPWLIRNVHDGILVALTGHDFDAMSAAAFVEELLELAKESGLRNVYFDFSAVTQLPGATIASLLTLRDRLDKADMGMILFGMNENAMAAFEAAGVAAMFDIRERLRLD